MQLPYRLLVATDIHIQPGLLDDVSNVIVDGHISDRRAAADVDQRGIAIY